MKLTSENVENIFVTCLFEEDKDDTINALENPNDAIKVEGLAHNFGFHPDRIKEHTGDIASMLDDLPNEFKADGGGGWSFLNACNDKNGNQWTGLHMRMEQLFMLGMAAGKVKYTLPREIWSALPGAMPYLQILGEVVQSGRTSES